MARQSIVCLDFETTSTDVKEAEIVQAASIVEDASGVHVHNRLFDPRCPIPPGASEVHGITDADVQGHVYFGRAIAQETITNLRGIDVLLTFNGASYDIPILERLAGEALQHACHVDVYRVWMHVRARAELMADMPADVFTGSLRGAHAWCYQRDFDGAHDALVDVRATLDVFHQLRIILELDAASLAELSATPLPGFVDMDGKIKWQGDDAALSFGKHAGTPLHSVDSSYLRWMLKSDFPADTRAIIQAALRGQFPSKDA